MVVEDDESIRNQLSDALPRLGFDVTVAADGLDALEILDTTVQPDLILSDIVMPGMSGIDLKKELAQSDRLASIPFVFVSALSSLHHVREGMQLAADDYVTKPFRLTELKAVLDAQLEKAQARSRYFNKSSQELVESLQLIFPHEIITPITVIHGFADFLKTLDQSNPKDRKMTQEMLDGIISAAQRLRQMTDRFTESVKSNLYQMKVGKDVLEEPFAFDIAEAARMTAERVAADRRAGGRLELFLEAGYTSVLREAFVRIVKEVVKNAIDYSPDSEFVTVTGNRKGESYLLVIKDRGHGMTADQISSVGMFVQFGRKSREQQGLGIGLAFSKRLAELIGAELSFAGGKETGTEVRILIPLDMEVSRQNN